MSKRALVTGGSGDIGAAICQQLAADGYFVYVHANQHLEKAEQIAEAIRLAGDEAEACTFDICNQDAVNSAVDNMFEGGVIQVLVHAAGIHNDAPLLGMTQEQWHSVIDVNLNGFFYVTQAVLMPMLRTRWGRIISLSSVANALISRGQANYAASKAGIEAASRILAKEVAKRGVTVNVVQPGIVQSDMAQLAFSDQDIAKLVPMERAAQPEEIADLVAFLASEKSSYMTAGVIPINGGMI